MQRGQRRSGKRKQQGYGASRRTARRGRPANNFVLPLAERGAVNDFAKSADAEVAEQEPVRCAFGAVRVGALLGRLRLHLQTDRFLAVHRGDAAWDAGCLQAALALAEVVSAMAQGDLDAPLASPQGQSHPSEDEGRGTRNTSSGRQNAVMTVLARKAHPAGDSSRRTAFFESTTPGQRGVR